MVTTQQINEFKTKNQDITSNMSDAEIADFMEEIFKILQIKQAGQAQSVEEGDEDEEGNITLVRRKSSASTKISLFVDGMTREARNEFLRDFMSPGGRIDGVSSDPAPDVDDTFLVNDAPASSV